MKRTDIYIIAAVLLLSAIGMYAVKAIQHDKEGKHVIISVDGKIYEDIAVGNATSKKIEVKTEYGSNIVYIHDGGAEVIDADCRDLICKKTGFISKPGQTIVCLPHKLVVTISAESGGGGDADAVSQ
ncbi:hypothetical protein EAL2_c16120 [Peptoclostridium acidaminophilum DSM 3953]|uniref:Uncharacterized protein n=1 Tax=Peptoclostridium acidaminophilum DSM 3953 TaxID=1286171 RepID=W8TL21_PEPAC|nr:NusG domain II-containing protein [Peptoclostridium acidaminophilum]AHM56907.1 hypothetical protein EAL2_c16120 [Peptoclostridium acidaminophilum DSM 3953]